MQQPQSQMISGGVVYLRRSRGTTSR